MGCCSTKEKPQTPISASNSYESIDLSQKVRIFEQKQKEFDERQNYEYVDITQKKRILQQDHERFEEMHMKQIERERILQDQQVVNSRQTEELKQEQ